MKISYIMPIFNESNIKNLSIFFKSKFFAENDENEVIICSTKNMLKNKDVQKIKKEHNAKIVEMPENFTYNDAFKIAVVNVSGDVLLLGDLKINNLDVVFGECLKKYDSGANYVHVKIRKSGFKGWCKKIVQNIYNFFTNIFTNKYDDCNITSLGLYDKNCIELFKALQNKGPFLKNTKNFIGQKKKTVYLKKEVDHYSPNYKQITPPLKAFFVSQIIVGICILALVLFSIFIKKNLAVYIIVASLTLILFVLLSVIFYAKHIFNIRNY